MMNILNFIAGEILHKEGWSLEGLTERVQLGIVMIGSNPFIEQGLAVQQYLFG